MVQQIKAGKLRALAHWGDRPLAALPGVPSLKELGYPAQFAQWSALFVPAATPPEIVQRLRAAAQKAAADPKLLETIARAGSPIDYLDAPAFQTYWDADAATMTKAVRRIGKVLIVHEDNLTCGFGAELAAQISRHAFSDLDGPIYRVAMADVPPPSHKHLFDAIMPTTQRVLAALEELVAW